MMRQAPANLRLKMLSDPANLAMARQSVETYCADNGFDTTACQEIGLCVNEALANIIRHAYDGATNGLIDLTAECDPMRVRIRIRDWGNGIHPEPAPSPRHDPLTPGGLGLLCLKRMMHSVVFKPQSDGMLLEMTREREDQCRS